MDVDALRADAGARVVCDLFGGAAGAGRGYVLAGHIVIGVDNNPELRADYMKSGAHGFECMDALEAIDAAWPSVDFYHASPPCQFYSQMSRCRPGIASTYPDLIAPVREALIATGRPFVIENVEAARPWMKNPVTLCGIMFGRPMYRHRLFEAGGGFTLDAAPAPPEDIREITEAACQVLGFAAPAELRSGRNKWCGWPHPVPTARAGHWEPGRFVSVSGHERRGPVNAAMDIN